MKDFTQMLRNNKAEFSILRNNNLNITLYTVVEDQNILAAVKLDL